MATKQSRKKPASRGKSSSSSRKSSRSSQPSIPRRAARHLAPWARDALGIGLIVLGMLAILGLWLDSGGPFGDAVDYLSHAFTGVAAVAMPVIALY